MPLLSSLFSTLFGCDLNDEFQLLNKQINLNYNTVMAKLSDLVQTLTDVKTELDKAKGEIVAKIDDLVSQLQNVELSPEATAALDALKGSAQALDDIVPDAVPTEPAPSEPAPVEPSAPEASA